MENVPPCGRGGRSLVGTPHPMQAPHQDHGYAGPMQRTQVDPIQNHLGQVHRAHLAQNQAPQGHSGQGHVGGQGRMFQAHRIQGHVAQGHVSQQVQGHGVHGQHHGGQVHGNTVQGHGGQMYGHSAQVQSHMTQSHQIQGHPGVQSQGHLPQGHLHQGQLPQGHVMHGNPSQGHTGHAGHPIEANTAMEVREDPGGTAAGPSAGAAIVDVGPYGLQISSATGGGSSGGSYAEEALVGRGAYGSVYKARAPNGDTVALKKMRMKVTQEGVPLTVIREISILRYLEKAQHKNVVKFLDVLMVQRGACDVILTFVFEYIQQDLSTYIKRCPPPGLPCEKIKDITYQMVSGVQFLHDNKIVHRDIKPQNILVSSTGMVKIADFGLSRIYTFVMTLTSVVVTLWYRAPEVLFQSSYASPVDMWSCGCILAEMIGRRPIFRGDSEINQLIHIFDVIGLPTSTEWPSGVSLAHSQFAYKPKTTFDMIYQHSDPDLIEILERTLQFSSTDRATAEEILNLVCFEGYEASAEQRHEDSTQSGRQREGEPGGSGGVTGGVGGTGGAASQAASSHGERQGREESVINVGGDQSVSPRQAAPSVV